MYVVEENALAHYGVKGQKWGVRHERKYVGKGRKTTKTFNGKDSKSSTEVKTSKNNRYHVDDDAAKALGPAIKAKVISDLTSIGINAVQLDFEGAALYAMDLATIPAMIAKSHFNENRFGKERAAAEVDPKTGLKKKSQELSVKADIKRSNPPGFGITEGSSNNCMLCTTAYDLRRRGYDVAAQITANGYTPDTLKEWYPKVKLSKEYSTPSGIRNGKQKRETIKMVQNELLAQGEGARGNFMVSWHYGGGHSMAYEIAGGKIMIRECQGNKTFPLTGIDGQKMLSNVESIQYARLDNVDFNPKTIKEIIR